MRWLAADVQDVTALGVLIRQQGTVMHLYLARWQDLGFALQKLLASEGNVILAGRVDGNR